MHVEGYNDFEPVIISKLRGPGKLESRQVKRKPEAQLVDEIYVYCM